MRRRTNGPGGSPRAQHVVVIVFATVGNDDIVHRESPLPREDGNCEFIPALRVHKVSLWEHEGPGAASAAETGPPRETASRCSITHVHTYRQTNKYTHAHILREYKVALVTTRWTRFFPVRMLGASGAQKRKTQGKAETRAGDCAWITFENISRKDKRKANERERRELSPRVLKPSRAQSDSELGKFPAITEFPLERYALFRVLPSERVGKSRNQRTTISGSASLFASRR